MTEVGVVVLAVFPPSSTSRPRKIRLNETRTECSLCYTSALFDNRGLRRLLVDRAYRSTPSTLDYGSTMFRRYYRHRRQLPMRLYEAILEHIAYRSPFLVMCKPKSPETILRSLATAKCFYERMVRTEKASKRPCVLPFLVLKRSELKYF